MDIPIQNTRKNQSFQTHTLLQSRRNSRSESILDVKTPSGLQKFTMVSELNQKGLNQQSNSVESNSTEKPKRTLRFSQEDQIFTPQERHQDVENQDDADERNKLLLMSLWWPNSLYKDDIKPLNTQTQSRNSVLKSINSPSRNFKSKPERGLIQRGEMTHKMLRAMNRSVSEASKVGMSISTNYSQ